MTQTASLVKNIFLTGEIQVGKSTMIKKILNDASFSYGGFATSPYFKKDVLRGFLLTSLNPRERDEASAVIGYCSEGCWNSVPEAFDGFGADVIRNAMAAKLDLIIMDELGFFESDASVFQEVVHNCLDSAVPVLGVLKAKSTDFLNSIKNREDTLVINLCKTDREAVFKQLTTEFNVMMGFMSLDSAGYIDGDMNNGRKRNV